MTDNQTGMTERRRVETIQIKLTPAEKKEIQNSAGSQPVSTYIRGQLLNQREGKTSGSAPDKTTPNKGTPQKKSLSEHSRPRTKPNFRDI